MSSSSEDPPKPKGPAEPSIYADASDDFYEPPPARVPTPAPGGDAPVVDAPVASTPVGDAPVLDALAIEATATGDAPRDNTPILPQTADLHEAVGAPTRKSRVVDSDEPGAPRNRKVMTVAAVSIFLGLLTLTLILLGRANSQRYLITCTADHVRAERGRAFPPWGSQLMGGNAYKPIPLPASAECKPQETQDVAELDHWYLDLLVERASATLTAPALDDPGKPLDVAEGQLNQALLLSRAPERRDQRKEVERLLGDVQYWRASLRLRDASVALSEAAKQFETAAAQRPRHVSDAGSWASFVKRVVDELHAGPNGVAAPGPIPSTSMPEQPTTATTTAPPGTALPVEPAAPPPAEPVEEKPDAGIPTGGVLL